MAFRKIKAGLVNGPINQHIGEVGNLFFDVDTGEIRRSDGTTPGGIPVIVSSFNSVAVGNTATTLDEFDINAYTTAKYIIQTVNSTNYHSMEAFLVNDKINAYLTVYASVTNNIKLINLDADISGGNVRLRATGITTNNSVKIFSTKI